MFLGNVVIHFIGPALTFGTMAEVMTTDSLRSVKAVVKDVGIADRQKIGCWANNMAENSHQPFRRRKWAMLRFQRLKTLQKLSSEHATFYNHFDWDRISSAVTTKNSPLGRTAR